jgi:hypothetical protein
METVIKVLIVALGALALLLVVATISGTIVWLLWPVVVEVFHAPALTWWQAIKITWICAILFKSSSTSSSK